MKKLLFLILGLLFTHVSMADTVNIDWLVDGQTYSQTTCTPGDTITPPTAPAKYGYTFREWRVYTPIEYIESTGTQYIDTGIVAKSGLNTKIKLSIKDATSGCALGTNSGGQFHPAFWYNGSWDSIVGTPDQNGGAVIPDAEYITEFNSNTNGFQFYVDGVLKNNGTATHDKTGNLWMFRRSGSNNFPMRGKIFYVQIYDNNTLVRDFIPVLDPNGVPCMYDKVTQQFFYNAGTGDFIAGPVVSE